MKRIIAFAAAHPRSVLGALLLLTLLAAWQATHVRISFSTDILIPSQGPAWNDYQETLRTFGATDSLVVVASDAQIFTPQKLQALKQAADRLAALPWVAGTDSLFSYKRGRLDEDERVHFAAYLGTLPRTVAEAEAVRDEALADPFVQGALLSRDGHTLVINVRLKADPGGGQQERAIVDAVGQAIAPLRGDFDEVFALGSPQVSDAISRLIIRDQRFILPVSLLALVFTLWTMLGRWQGVVLPLMTAGTSILWTLALMAIIGVGINVVTAVVPLLLIVVGSTEDIHLLATYFDVHRDGVSRMRAIDRMASVTGLAVLLTFITTYLGFLSIALNDIGLLRDFGVVASSGLLFNFVITIFGVPAMLALAGGTAPRLSASPVERYRSLADALFRVTSRYRVGVLMVAALMLLAGVIGSFGLRVNNDTMAYLPADSPIVEQTHRLHTRLAGVEHFDLVVSSGIEGTFERVRYLKEIEKLQRFLDASGLFDKTRSFVDILKEADRIMEGLASGERTLPEDDAVVRELLLFLDGDYRDAYVDWQLSTTRIDVRHGISDSRELARAIASIRGFVASDIDPGLRVRLTGKSILTHQAADSLMSGQIESLALVIVVIFLVIAALFVNLKAGLLAVIPNLLPVVILFGVMGFAGIPLNTGTAMIAAIAIGISVDDTMHFMVRYHREMARQPSTDAAIQVTMQEEAGPIATTSVALMFGFGALSLSSFPPVREFGLLGAMVFALALAATFLLTPILLARVRLVTLWDLLGVRVKTRLMERCALFEGMRRFQVRHLIAMCSRQRFVAGDIIIRQGDRSDELFVILDGRVQACRHAGAGAPEVLSTLSTGDLFGEIAPATDIRRTADVVALETTDLLVLHWKDLQQLIRYMPRTASRLLMNLAAGMGRRFAARDL
ncbi:MAG: MMPL family transporter [Candidatus Thiodiazotropha sp.]